MEFGTDIPGYVELVKWCSGWPSFHDAEIVRLDLNRSGVSTLIVEVRGGPKPNFGPRANPIYGSPPSNAVVTFLFEDIEDLELAGFSHQNVVFDLWIEKQGTLYRISLAPCFGLAGWIDCGKLEIKFHL